MHIVWLGRPECADAARVGGKAANLSRLAARHPVPPGFCLPAATFAEWFAHPSTAAAGASPAEPLSDTLPDSLRAALCEAYAELGRLVGRPAPQVAVRSSAVDEDGSLASFAGQHESYLNITGAEALCAAVARCFASARSERALAYRRQQGLEPQAQLAVLVQELVPADVAAVAFSADPVAGRRDQVMINAAWGLGESIVGGTVTPDTYWVDKTTLAPADVRIAAKTRMHVPGPNGTREVPVPRLLQEQPALSEAQCAQLARLTCALEAEMGWPVDIEAAFAGEALYLLQCRPITRIGR
ncbi:MAG TPA: PEP/pyruvate-binding domain-containing protein [Limnochordia bacterium]|nr:PEP/pyruvate-binding domain-containing protein [Limnochordia bacterium]